MNQSDHLVIAIGVSRKIKNIIVKSGFDLMFFKETKNINGVHFSNIYQRNPDIIDLIFNDIPEFRECAWNMSRVIRHGKSNLSGTVPDIFSHPIGPNNGIRKLLREIKERLGII